MAITIKTETFTEITRHERYVEGTVILNIDDQQHVAKATRFYSRPDRIYVNGFIGRYETSIKPWRASVDFNKDGNLHHVSFGRDDRSGRFRKANMISYDPELCAKI